MSDHPTTTPSPGPLGGTVWELTYIPLPLPAGFDPSAEDFVPIGECNHAAYVAGWRVRRVQE